MTDMYEIEESNYPTFKAVGNALWRAPGWLGRGVIRVWRRVWRFVVALLALLILAHLILNIVAGRRLEAELNRIRAAGQPLTLAEAAPPKVPDSQNAAPLYQQAFNGLRKPEADEDIAAAFPGLGTLKSRPTLAEVEAVLARHRADFRLLEEASRRPACRFPVNWEAGLAATFPHYAGVRGATRFLTAKALVEAKRGRAAEALNDLAIEVRLVNHIGAEPTLIAQLVRIACTAIAFWYVPEILAAAPPSEAESRALYDLLSEVDTRGRFIPVIETERAFGISFFDEVRRAGPATLGRLYRPPGVEYRHRLGWGDVLDRGWPVLRWVWEPLLKLEEVYYLRYTRETIAKAAALVKMPYPQAREGLRQLEVAPIRAPRYVLVSYALLPLPLQAFQRVVESDAMVGLMRGALALRAYQIEHGDYPASLAELKARGGWPIADDPFSGKPFVYRREGKGYILYSVGWDGIDNGGISQGEAIRKAGMVNWRWVQYDIPLRMPR